MKIVDDQVGSPTLADNLAQMLLALLDSDRRELYNTVGDTVIDRYAFSVMAARLFQLDTGLIDRIKTSDLNQPAPRPLRAGLIMEKFKREFPEIQVLTAEQALLALKGHTCKAVVDMDGSRGIKSPQVPMEGIWRQGERKRSNCSQVGGG